MPWPPGNDCSKRCSGIRRRDASATRATPHATPRLYLLDQRKPVPQPIVGLPETSRTRRDETSPLAASLGGRRFSLEGGPGDRFAETVSHTVDNVPSRRRL